jgi:predicted permease
MLFGAIAKAEVEIAEHGDAVAVLLSCMILCIAAAYLVAWVFRAPAGSAGTLVQSAFRGNMAFVGLPVLIYSSLNGPGDSIVAIAVILLSVMVPTYNVAAVSVLLVSQHRLSWLAMRRVLIQILTNPLILAVAAGALYATTGLPIPLILDYTFETLGQTAFPLALLGVGGVLELEKMRGSNFPLVCMAGLIKVVLGPTAGYSLAMLLGLSPEEIRIVCVFLAAPTAVASFVLADQLGGDRSLAAGTVALSTLLSLVSLWVAVWLTQARIV